MDGKHLAPKSKRIAKTKVVNAVDLFCGAGGTSTGLVNAVNDLGYEIKLTAINHWDVAIATHTKNHEDVEHFCQSIDTIDPFEDRSRRPPAAARREPGVYTSLAPAVVSLAAIRSERTPGC
jgi:hypothetical protein